MSIGILTSHIRVLKNLKLNDIPYDKVLGLVASKIADDDADYSHIKKRKTTCQMILLSASVCGIEFCYAAETAFVSPTLLQIGVPVYYMTLIWCLSPLLGFFLVPLLGSMSDRCRSKLGRRRPFILLLSVGIILGLILVPNAKTIGVYMGDVFPKAYTSDSENQNVFSNMITTTETSVKSYKGAQSKNRFLVYNVFNRNYSKMYFDGELPTSTVNEDITQDSWVATTVDTIVQYSTSYSLCFTVIGVVILDFSCDACQSPCRAYMLDVTVPDDHSVGLSTFTLLAGLGGALGYVMGGINWGGTSLGTSMGGHIKAVFSMVLVLYLIFLMLTITSIKEIPLDKLGVTKEDLQKKKKCIDGSKYKKFTNEDDDENVSQPVVNQNNSSAFQQGHGSTNENMRVDLQQEYDYGSTNQNTKVDPQQDYAYGSTNMDPRVDPQQRYGLANQNTRIAPQQEYGYGQNATQNVGTYSHQRYGSTNENRLPQGYGYDLEHVSETPGAGSTNGLQMTPIVHDSNLPNGYQGLTGTDSMMDNKKLTNMEESKSAAEGMPADYQHEGLPMAAEVSLKTYLLSIVNMPRSLWILCLTNLFSWMSLVCYSLYFTDFVGQAIYDGDPSAPEGSPAHNRYNEGVRMGSFGMSLYSLSCSIYSLNIERLVKKFGKCILNSFCMIFAIYIYFLIWNDNLLLGEVIHLRHHVNEDILFSRYYTAFYGSQVLPMFDKCMEDMYKAWRIAIRRVCRVPWTTHCLLLLLLSGFMDIELWFSKRCVKFLKMAINSKNSAVRMIINMG